MALYEDILKCDFHEQDRMSEEQMELICKIVEGVCYQTLQHIKSILEDDSLEDEACFEKIEAIVCLFEEIDSGCGTRHDFG